MTTNVKNVHDEMGIQRVSDLNGQWSAMQQSKWVHVAQQNITYVPTYPRKHTQSDCKCTNAISRRHLAKPTTGLLCKRSRQWSIWLFSSGGFFSFSTSMVRNAVLLARRRRWRLNYKTQCYQLSYI